MGTLPSFPRAVMWMGTLSGEAKLLFLFLPSILLVVNSLRQRAALSREAIRKSQKLFPFVKIRENHGVELIHFNKEKQLL